MIRRRVPAVVPSRGLVHSLRLPSGRTAPDSPRTNGVRRVDHPADSVGRERDSYAVGVLATGDPVAAGVTGGGGGGVIGAQVLAGGGPAGI